MGQYIAAARSNYFAVKDKDAFLEAMNTNGYHVVPVDQDDGFTITYGEPHNAPAGEIALFGGGEGWPVDLSVEEKREEWKYENPDHPEGKPLPVFYETLTDLIGAHLVEGSVAVLEEAGAEKLRYLNGSAVAVNHRQEVVSISIADIYDKAKAAFGPEATITDAAH